MTYDVILQNAFLVRSQPASKPVTTLELSVQETDPLPAEVGQALIPLTPELPVQPVPAGHVPQPAEFPFVHETNGALTVTVPFGYEHAKVNAVSFKALAGRPTDTLLRKQGSRWEIVDDAALVDLSNTSVLYKLGPVEIYS